MPASPRFLLIRFHFIGDVMLVTPLLENLKRQFPDCYTALLTDDPAAEVVRDHPALDELLVFRTADWKQLGRLARLKHTLGLYRRLRRANLDYAFNLHPGDRGGLAAWISGAPKRVGFDRPGERMGFYNVRAPYNAGGQHRIEHHLDILRAAGIAADLLPASIGIGDADRAAVRPYLEDNKPLVLLHPGRPLTRKAWPEENFARLADALCEEFGARVIFVGATGEEERVESIRTQMREPSVSVVAKLSLKELAALAERASLFIGIDSGPLHVASAAGAPTVALFGFSDPVQWNPPGPAHIALQKQLPDHPCNPPHCCRPGDSPCMKNISVAEVLEAARRLYH